MSYEIKVALILVGLGIAFLVGFGFSISSGETFFQIPFHFTRKDDPVAYWICQAVTLILVVVLFGYAVMVLLPTS